MLKFRISPREHSPANRQNLSCKSVFNTMTYNLTISKADTLKSSVMGGNPIEITNAHK